VDQLRLAEFGLSWPFRDQLRHLFLHFFQLRQFNEDLLHLLLREALEQFLTLCLVKLLLRDPFLVQVLQVLHSVLLNVDICYHSIVDAAGSLVPSVLEEALGIEIHHGLAVLLPRPRLDEVVGAQL